MQFTIRGEPTEILINTITLSPGEETTNINAFHCTQCGQTVCQYQGRVTKMYPIVEPGAPSLVVSKCRVCHAYYTFQTFAYTNKQIKVILHPQTMGTTYFYCHVNRGEPILSYNYDKVYSLVDREEKTLPFTSVCRSPVCDELYYFADIV